MKRPKSELTTRKRTGSEQSIKGPRARESKETQGVITGAPTGAPDEAESAGAKETESATREPREPDRERERNERA